MEGGRNQYWSASKPVLVTKRSSTGHYMQPLLVGARTTTGRSPPFIEYKESPPQARISELVGGLAIWLGNYFLRGRTLVSIPTDVCAL